MRHRVHVSNFDAALRVVQANLAISVVPREVALSYAAYSDVRVIALADPWARRRFAISYRDEAQLRLHARIGLVEVDGLGDVIHAAGFKAFDNMLGFRQARHENDGNVAHFVHLLDSAAGLETIDARHDGGQRALRFRLGRADHLAAESHVDRSIDAPAEFVHTNVGGTATAQLQTTAAQFGAGTHVLTATYNSDPNFAGSTSANTAYTVNKAPTTTAITGVPSAIGVK
mgnify:CR=1 FL=1